MRKFILFVFILIHTSLFAQDINKIINSKEVLRIESVLASDSLQGRKIFTPGIEKAADFINNEFRKAGLQTPDKQKDFRQQFIMLKPTLTNYSYAIDNNSFSADNVLVITSQKEISVNEKSGFENATIEKGDNFFQKAVQILRSGKNTIVFVDTSFKQSFPRLVFFKRQMNPSNTSIVFLLASQTPQTFNIKATHSFDTLHLEN